MQELRRILKLHANWLLYATVGESALTTLELAELREYGKLPMDSALDLVDKSYFLGRMRSTQKVSEYKKASKVVPATLNPVEEGTLEAARTKSLVRLKKIADDAMGTFVVDTTLVGNQKAIDVKKQAWSSAVRTEFQAAKIQGIANTIANRSDLYANSDGPESDVSVIPARQCCEDCREHYLDKDGNPKIFKLSELMASGSNADQGVIHTKTAGKHPYWKTTLPPLHPNCGCTLVYVPPGHAWVDGKLSLLNKSLFLEHISKATAGVRGPGLSGTVAPTGAPSLNKPAGHPSVPGAAAPGNVAGPGRPPGLSPKPGSGSGGPGGGPQYAPCPFGGGAECISHGGNGATMHKPGGSIMKKHQEAMARGAKPKTPQAIEAQRKQMESSAQEFNAKPNHNQVVTQHLSEGKIGSVKKLGGQDAGINASYKIAIVGNGSGLMKPPINGEAIAQQVFGSYKNKNDVAAPGFGTLPEGMSPHCEVGAHSRGVVLGVKVPVTVLRHHDGSDDGPVGITSVQQWQDNAVSIRNYANTEKFDYSDIMKAVPKEHQEKFHKQLSDIAVMDGTINNGDRHFGNFMVDSKTHDVIPIDHGASFGNGLAGHRNDIAYMMHRANKPLQISPEMHSKLKNESLESTMRSLDGSGMPEWMQGQTFLRQKYVLHLQEKHGHIPFERFKGTRMNNNGEVSPYPEQWGGTMMEGMKNFYKAQEAGELPHDKFESWAKNWMSTTSANESHPDFQDAKRLMEMQPLRPYYVATGEEQASKGTLQNHFDSIRPYDDSDISSLSEKQKTEYKPLRVAPDMPGTKASKDSTIDLDDADLEPVEDKNAMAYDRTPLALDMDEFKESDVRSKKNKPLSLDLAEYQSDEMTPAAPDKTAPAKKVKKSLYLQDPSMAFPLDFDPER